MLWNPRHLAPTASQLHWSQVPPSRVVGCGPACNPAPLVPIITQEASGRSAWPAPTLPFSFPPCLDPVYSLPSSPLFLPTAFLEPRPCARPGNAKMPVRSRHPGMFHSISLESPRAQFIKSVCSGLEEAVEKGESLAAITNVMINCDDMAA